MRLFRRDRSAPMDCREVGRLLQRYLDGELDEHRSRRLAGHLEDCRRCGLEATTYEQIKATLAQRRGRDVPRESLERLTEFAYQLVRGDESTLR
jgi:anti-sigma factor (TIGR02949 family)